MAYKSYHGANVWPNRSCQYTGCLQTLGSLSLQVAEFNCSVLWDPNFEVSILSFGSALGLWSLPTLQLGTPAAQERRGREAQSRKRPRNSKGENTKEIKRIIRILRIIRRIKIRKMWTIPNENTCFTNGWLCLLMMAHNGECSRTVVHNGKKC